MKKKIDMDHYDDKLSTLKELRDYINENFELNSQNRIVRKNPGPDVVIIDHLNLLTNDKDKL